jgi:hypothetical protein
MPLSIKRTGECLSVQPEFTQDSHCAGNHSTKWKGSTVGFHMSPEQALELAEILVAVSRRAERGQQIAVIVHRDTRRHSGKHRIQIHAVS